MTHSTKNGIRVNLYAKVNKADIRRVKHNGREHWVLPSYTLPSDVIMNGGLYTAAEIDKHYASLEGTLAPLGHPTLNGEYISAFSAEAINANHVGAWNRNVKKSGNRIYIEKWVDVETASATERGQELLTRIEAISNGEDVPPIHTSVGLFLNEMEANAEQKAMGAEWVASISLMDHDAILLHEVGAATPEQGVGLMVNSAKTSPIAVNSGVLVGESYQEKQDRLRAAAIKQFGNGSDNWVGILDFTDSHAIVTGDNVATAMYAYTDNGSIVFDAVGVPVERSESWVAIAANKLKNLFNPQAQSANPPKEDDMSLTKEEKAELVDEISKAVLTSVNEALAPIGERMSSLEVNQQTISDSLTAGARAEEAAHRKIVAAAHGEIVANGMSGEALAAMAKTLKPATGIGHGVTGASSDPSMDFDQVPQ